MPNQSTMHTHSKHKKHIDPKQESWGKGRGGRPWMRKRERVFRRDKFLCQEHKRNGILVSVDLHGKNAGMCDHIIPKAEGGTDDDDNLGTLCKPCHKIKTQAESKRAQYGA